MLLRLMLFVFAMEMCPEYNRQFRYMSTRKENILPTKHNGIYNTKPNNCDCKCAQCTFDEHYYCIRTVMDAQNIPIINKQQINNTLNALDVYNVIDALKRVIYKIGIKTNETNIIICM